MLQHVEPSMSEPLVSCRNLTVKVGQKTLLDDVSFDVAQGEHRVILGPNGAGKSTLLRAILGFLKTEYGEIKHSGNDKLTRRELAKRVAYVPQLLAAEIPYTVEEFIAMGRYAHDGTVNASVQQAMESVGVLEFSDRVVSTLSGGERQRVCIAAALAQDAPLIILDEPLVHLDPGQRREVQNLIRGLMEKVTVLVVTHDIAWAKRDFTNLLVIDKSQLVYDGDLGEFYGDGGIDRLFGEGVYCGQEGCCE